jgi:hypothetical protein
MLYERVVLKIGRVINNGKGPTQQIHIAFHNRSLILPNCDLKVKNGNL